jgi:two-component system, cell cycle response regulator
MKKYAGRRRTDVEPHAGSPAMTALIVDDETSYRTYVTSLAEKVGFTADGAFDGNAALSLLSNSHYDLLLVNIEANGLNAFELIAHVRADEATRSTYTIVMTSHDDSEKKIAALSAGYDDVLSKTAPELTVVSALVGARRTVARQHAFDEVVRDLYGLASRDELTSVFNRRFFMSETEKLLRQGGPLTLVLFDLDNFKHINDTFGHLVGDRVLRDVGALFLRRTRPEDLVARYGGDEFVMLVAGAPFYLVESVAERLLGEMRNLEWTVNADQFSVGASIGFGSTHTLPGATLAQLLDAADRDLYRHKSEKKQAPEPKPRVASPSKDRVIPLPQSIADR